MATDEEYMAFLDKANRDPSEGYAQPQSGGNSGSAWQFKATDEGVEVPAALQRVARDDSLLYTSDADEPFVAVALRLKEGGKEGEASLPDEGASVLTCLLHGESLTISGQRGSHA